MTWERLRGTSRSNQGLSGSLSVGSGDSYFRRVCRDLLGSRAGAHPVLSATRLGGACEHVCLWEIREKNPTLGPTKGAAAHRRQAERVLWVV